ncbi:MAG: hypothetical protein DRP60_17560, partial [Spirochaetes bacterium]
QRIKEAEKELRSLARKKPVLAAEGTILFFRKLEPAVEQVDDSSGRMGGVINRTIGKLLPIVAKAPADPELRALWLEQLKEIAQGSEYWLYYSLSENWGNLCGTDESARFWLEEWQPRMEFSLQSPDFAGRSTISYKMLFSTLERLGLWEDIIRYCPDNDVFLRHFGLWKIRALAALGQVNGAVALADRLDNDQWVYRDFSTLAEGILRNSGRVDEAYTRYALPRPVTGTYLAYFRRLKKDYPDRDPLSILDDLINQHSDNPGAWFAASRREGFRNHALELARNHPVNPPTLMKAADSLKEEDPRFAMEAAAAAIHWIVEGYGYEMDIRDFVEAWVLLRSISEPVGYLSEWQERIQELITNRTERAFPWSNGELLSVLGI